MTWRMLDLSFCVDILVVLFLHSSSLFLQLFQQNQSDRDHDQNDVGILYFMFFLLPESDYWVAETKTEIETNTKTETETKTKTKTRMI